MEFKTGYERLGLAASASGTFVASGPLDLKLPVEVVKLDSGKSKRRSIWADK